MAEINGSKKAIIPAIAVVTILLAMFGWMRFDIGNNAGVSSRNAGDINENKILLERMDGKLEKVLETLRWLEKWGEKYESANSQTSIDGFIDFVKTNNK